MWIINNSGTTFVPNTITINLGDTVTWVIANAHNVVQVSQATWNANLNTPLPGGFSTPFGGGTVYPNKLTVGTHYYVCEPHAANGMKGIIIVQSCAVPDTPGAITGLSSVCQGTTNSYNIAPVTNATFYTWTLPSGWTGTSTTTSINAIAGASGGDITVVAANSCYSSAPQTKTVSVNPLTSTPGVISGNTQVCSGSVNVYSIAPVEGASSYTWTLPSGWTGTSTTTSISTTAGTTSGNVSVSANNSCGASTARTLNVTVFTTVPGLSGNISGNATICTNSANTYSINASATATSYTWTLPAGWSGSSITNSILAISGASGGTISVTGNNACGSSTPKTKTVTVSGGSAPAQPGSITGNQSICAGVQQTYSITPVAGATSYAWVLPAGWSGSSATTSITATTGSASGDVTVSAVNSCGSSAPQSLAVAVTSAPATPAAIAGNTIVCKKSTVTYSITPVDGATSYTWTLPPGWTGTSTTTSIDATASSTSGNITVKANNSCGSSAARSLPITVTSVDVSVTQAGSVLTANNSGAAYQWFNCMNNLPEAGATSQSFTATFNGSYSVIVTKGGCTDTSSCFTVTTAIPFTQIPIPDTLSGADINLTMYDTAHQFFNGIRTATAGYNGGYLGPTLILNKGQLVNMHVTNLMSDTSTTHWHGLHVAPMNDGGPHTVIVPGTTWNPSFPVMDNASTCIYHPHQHHLTMEHVVLGQAGVIIVRDTNEAKLLLPRRYGIDDFPLVCQFKHFDNAKQIVIDDKIDNMFMVNGALNPMLNVPAQVVRLRIVNASSSRVLEFGFNDGRTFYQIAGDNGLLNNKVPLTRVRLGSAERAEILVDFSGQSGKTFFINQYGNELPEGFPGGMPMMGDPMGPFDNITFSFLRINVVEQTADPVTTMPDMPLANNVPWDTTGAYSMDFFLQGDPPTSTTHFTINGQYFDMNVINFTRQLGDVMVWNITNQSMMAHPFHIHGGHFYILSIDGQAPPENMRGRKDVVLLAPIEGTATVVMKFEDFYDTMIPYMYHCHILSHEDDGMLQQFLVLPPPTPNTWTGTISTDWHNAGNWSWAIVPGIHEAAIIPAGTPFSPIVKTGTIANCYSLSILPGAIFTVQTNATLNIVH